MKKISALLVLTFIAGLLSLLMASTASAYHANCTAYARELYFTSNAKDAISGTGEQYCTSAVTSHRILAVTQARTEYGTYLGNVAGTSSGWVNGNGTAVLVARTNPKTCLNGVQYYYRIETSQSATDEYGRYSGISYAQGTWKLMFCGGGL